MRNWTGWPQRDGWRGQALALVCSITAIVGAHAARPAQATGATAVNSPGRSAVNGPAQGADQAEVLLQAALHVELSEGDLERAIELYRDIVTTHTGNRNVVARALLRMGRCYEKLGESEAQEAYQRVLRDYPDQPEQVSAARTRLAALTQPAGTADPSGLVVRRVWVAPFGVEVEGSVTPDGRYIAADDESTGNPEGGHLVVRDLTTGENLSFAHTKVPGGDVNDAQMSPDGKRVAYSWDNEDRSVDVDLRIIGLDGSEPRVLYRHEDVVDLDPKGWSPDGQQILARFLRKDGTRQIVMVSVADGSVRVLKSLGWWDSPEIHLSPDGRYIAYDVSPQEDVADDIFLLAADGSREVPVVAHAADDEVLGWAPDGKRLLFTSNRSGTVDLWLIEIADGKPQGSPRLVKINVGPIEGRGFNRDGAFYYTPAQFFARDVYTAMLDPATGRVLVPPRRATERFATHTLSPDWSPDGKYLAYSSGGTRGPEPGIVIRSLETGEERDLSIGLRCQGLRWSPDGRSILVRAFSGKEGLYQIDAQTGDVTPVLVQSSSRIFDYDWPAGWSPDGKAIFYGRFHYEGGTRKSFQLLVRNLESGEETELYRQDEAPFIFSELALSPDGQHLAFVSPNQAGGALKMISTRDGELRELLSVQKPEHIDRQVVAWTPDGRYLLFGKRNRYEATFQLWRIPAEGGEPERIELEMALPRPSQTSFKVVAETGLMELAVHPDGRRIVFSAYQRIQSADELWVMENFLPDLEGSK